MSKIFKEDIDWDDLLSVFKKMEGYTMQQRATALAIKKGNNKILRNKINTCILKYTTDLNDHKDWKNKLTDEIMILIDKSNR